MRMGTGDVASTDFDRVEVAAAAPLAAPSRIQCRLQSWCTGGRHEGKEARSRRK